MLQQIVIVLALSKGSTSSYLIHFPDSNNRTHQNIKMKYQIVFLVSLACVLIATRADETPEKVCEPGSTFKKDCNECKCNTDGTDAACTRKFCNGQPTDGDNPAPESEQKPAEDDSCVPGETYKKDCNDCTCPPSGRKSEGLCTLLGCIDAGFKQE